MGLFNFFKNRPKPTDAKLERSPDSIKNDLVVVFAGASMEAEIVRNMLQNSGIMAFLKDQNVGTLAPWYTSPGGAGAVKIVVNDYDYEEAKAIIEAYEEKK